MPPIMRPGSVLQTWHDHVTWKNHGHNIMLFMRYTHAHICRRMHSYKCTCIMHVSCAPQLVMILDTLGRNAGTGYIMKTTSELDRNSYISVRSYFALCHVNFCWWLRHDSINPLTICTVQQQNPCGGWN